MLDRITKMFEAVYQLIALNFIFLVLNAGFFQIFFAIDFRPIYFPLYYLVSLTLIPSSIIVLRLVNTTRSWNQLLSEFRRVLGQWRLWLLLPLVIYLNWSNLYVLQNHKFLFVINLTLLILAGLFICQLIANATVHTDALIKITCQTFVRRLPATFGIAIVCITVLLIGFKLSFLAMILVFGIIAELIVKWPLRSWR